MAVYLVDTDIFSLLQRDHPLVMAAIAAHTQDQVCISTITIEEQISGWSSLARTAKAHAEQEFASQILSELVSSWCRLALMPFTKPAILRFEQLMKARLNVKGNDLRIAAIALELGATVVTRNRRDFDRVPGLTIQDWSV